MSNTDKEFIKEYMLKWLPKTLPTKTKFVNADTEYFIDCMFKALDEKKNVWNNI